MSSDRESAEAAYRAFGRGDLETLAQWFDPSIEWIEPPDLPGARSYRGRSRVVEYLASILRVWEKFAVEPRGFEERADGFLVDIHIRALARQSGVSVEDRVVHEVTMRDGKATRVAVHQRKDGAER